MIKPNAGNAADARGDAFVQALEKNAQAGAKNEGFVIEEIVTLLKELEARGVKNLPEEVQAKIMPLLVSGKQALSSFPSGVTNVLESLGDTAVGVGAAVAENAAPVAKKSLDLAAAAHVLSIVGKDGVVVGGLKAIPAGINNAITVAAGKFVIDRLQKMLQETGSNTAEAVGKALA